MARQLKIIYLISTIPLLIGSLTFIYWYIKRSWFAENLDIELFVFFTILVFLIAVLATIILCSIFASGYPTDRKNIIPPIIIVLLTFPMVCIYGTLYDLISEKAFVRVINDTDNQIIRIWSANFEKTYYDKKGNDFIISYYPVYTYNWTEENSGEYDYTINGIHVDTRLKNTKLKTLNFPLISKGECRIVRLSNIEK